MTREEVILAHIKRDGLGLEIGAGSEFYIAHSRTGELPAGTRQELLQQVDREQSLS